MTHREGTTIQDFFQHHPVAYRVPLLLPLVVPETPTAQKRQIPVCCCILFIKIILMQIVFVTVDIKF